LIGPVNAFEKALPEVFSKEVIALVDIGFKCTSICILQEEELILSRVVGLGGDRLTTTLSEAMNISYAEAEGIKVGLPDEVQSIMVSLLSPLGRELRASIDFFEHQQDKPVTQVFVSGGSARSDYIVQILQSELMVPCERWDPTGSLINALAPQQMAELDQVTPQLAVVIGAALSAL
jgi:type IV pilus assembly protein PilM